MTEIYHYDNNGLFTDSSFASMSPRQPNVPLVPKNATLMQPATPSKDEIAQFNGQNWLMVDDYRGFNYFTPEDGEVTIQEIKITPPQGHTEVLFGEKVMFGEDGLWKIMEYEDYLDVYKNDRINELQTLFISEFKSGLISDALGSDHKYDTEQHNIDWFLTCLNATINTVSITCDDLQNNTNSKIPRDHNQGQKFSLLDDVYESILEMKTKFRSLRQDVYDAVDETAVDLIVW